MVFSNSLEIFDGQIGNLQLAGSLSALADHCGKELKLLKWSETRIAIPLTVEVNLPTRGTKDGIDIQPKEPVILVFDLEKYPQKAPMVFTDRLDFPKDSLAHLYIASAGKPPAICYVRGKMDDWYSGKRVQDLVIRITNWFQEAASGQLTENGEQFDPLRMEGYDGTMIFDYDLFSTLVDKASALAKYFAIFFEEREERKKKSAALSFHFENFVAAVKPEEIVELIRKERAKAKNAPDRREFVFGSLFFDPKRQVYPSFEIDFPRDLGQLKLFAQKFGIEKSSIEHFLNTLSTSKNVPVVLAIKRSKQVIGFSGQYEFINFCIKPILVDKVVSDSSPVKLCVHNQPVTTAAAKRISGEVQSPNQPLLVYGCGALGSKIIDHLSRAGIRPSVLVDPDELSPHNLVRHSLDGRSVGLNKADELAKKVNGLFPGQKPKVFGFKMLSKELRDFAADGWLLDFTASTNFGNERIIDSYTQRVIKAGISDMGNVGYLLKEGSEGNPRIDDLEAVLHYQAIQNPDVSKWLRNERDTAKNGNSFLRVGVGCNSETTTIADDTISLHAAVMSRQIKREVSSPIENGKILFQSLDQEVINLTSASCDIAKFDVYPAENGSGWSIRFASGIVNRMNAALSAAGSNETGGVFVGLANYKTMTIHVLDIVDAPADSAGTPVHFHRGASGLKEHFTEIIESTGEQLGYVGEWHTHPHGPEHWSSVDRETMERFKKEYRGMVTPLPVFMTVVTKNKIYPYVI